MVTITLRTELAEEIFRQEAVSFSGHDAIPEYRVRALFGEESADFIKRAVHNGLMDPGSDYNTYFGGDDRPGLMYLRKTGFLKVVTDHNYRCCLSAERRDTP